MRSSKQNPAANTLEVHIYREMLRLLESNKEAIIQNIRTLEVVWRRNTGYALDRFVRCSAPHRPAAAHFNLARAALRPAKAPSPSCKPQREDWCGPSPAGCCSFRFSERSAKAMHATVLDRTRTTPPAAVTLTDDIIIPGDRRNY